MWLSWMNIHMPLTLSEVVCINSSCQYYGIEFIVKNKQKYPFLYNIITSEIFGRDKHPLFIPGQIESTNHCKECLIYFKQPNPGPRKYF